MGIYTDFLANATTVDTGGDDGISIGVDKVVTKAIESLQAMQGDRDYPAAYDAIDEVQSIAVYSGTVSGGTFTLTISLFGLDPFTTAAIAFDADAATIEAAIDTAAAAASVPNFVAGDIAVTGGDLGSAPVVLTYSGDSVAGANHDEVVIDGTSLTGGGTAGDESVTTEGQSKRTSWAILNACGAIGGTIPVQGDTPDAITAATNRENNSLLPDQNTLRALAHAAAVEDGNAEVETEILRVLSLS